MRMKNLAILAVMGVALAGCTQEEVMDISTPNVSNKTEYQLSGKIVDTMNKLGMDRKSPILMRIYKEEGVLEIWKAKTNGRYDMLKQYKICAWSGVLGPKRKVGDRQAPEGFYTIEPWQMNPNSKYYLAFNTGFPNQYDRVHNYSGTDLMVHGACSSSGCYSMTDAQMLEIFALARDAFRGGQKAFQLQALPFRLTADNMARHRDNPNIDFWKMLKVGYDHFELTKRPPEVAVCDKKYVFNQVRADGSLVTNSSQCGDIKTAPTLASAYSSYEASYSQAYAEAEKKLRGYVWDEPSEAERKAVVAKWKKGKDIAFAPTGTGLQAGKLVRVGSYNDAASQSLLALAAGKTSDAKDAAATATASASPIKQTDADKAIATNAAAAAGVTEQGDAVTQTGSVTKTPAATIDGAVVPVPEHNPNAVVTEAAPVAKKKPFWKLWSTQ